MLGDMKPYKAILLAHEEPGQEMPLVKTYEFAARAIGRELDSEVLSILKRARLKAQEDGMVVTRRRSRHFYTSVTEKGWAWLESADSDDESPDASPMPELPFRVGRGHLLGRAQFREVVDACQRGELDLLVVRPGAAAKVRYWDA